MRKWFRILDRTVACVLLGIITNMLVVVAVEWADVQRGYIPATRYITRQWIWNPPSEWPELPSAHRIQRNFGISRQTTGAMKLTRDAVIHYVQGQRALGFPAYCVLDQYYHGRSTIFPREGSLGTFSPFADARIRIPLTPQWPGMLINITTYGALWAVLFMSIAAIRRSRLRAQGSCVQCRYDMRGLAKDTPCPECGHLPTANLNPLQSRPDNGQ